MSCKLVLVLCLLNTFEMAHAETAWNSWVGKSAQSVSSDNNTLAPFKDIVGSATVVGFGESDHGLHDIQQFRNRLFQFLVNEMDFRGIALESGVLEAQIVERYIQGDKTVTLSDALKKGITHRMGLSEEVRDLVNWMKHYNSKQIDKNKKLHFFGYDLPVVGDAPLLPLEELGTFVKKINADFYTKNLSPLIALAEKQFFVTKTVKAATKKYMEIHYPGTDLETVEIDPDQLDAYGTIGFEQLNSTEQTNLEVGI